MARWLMTSLSLDKEVSERVLFLTNICNRHLSNTSLICKVHCELDGVTCGQNGKCGPGTLGCICHSRNFTGEYCSVRAF
jgi:hypothetical protein